LKAEFNNVINTPWLGLEPIRLGGVPKPLVTADAFVLVSEHERPIARIDIYCNHFAFKEVIVWQNLVVIGIGDEVYFVNVETGKFQTLRLGNYFGHLYTHNDLLLIASADRLFCLHADGRIKWISEEVGIDGVIVATIDDKFIDGEGEWDPPGGWKSFRLEANSGKLVQI
jgi:hypothetical protein